MNDSLKKQIDNMEELEEIIDLLHDNKELKSYMSVAANKRIDPAFAKDRKTVPFFFNKKGDTIYILGSYRKNTNDTSSIIELLYDAFDQNLVSSAYALKNIGLFFGLAQACYVNKLGFDITADAEMNEKEFLFQPKNSTFLISVSAEQEDKFVDYMYNNGIPLTLLGHVTKGELRMDDLSFGFIEEYA